MLVPSQPDPKGSLEWTEIRLQGSDSLALRASKKLKGEEMLLVQMGGVRLRLELDRIPLWRGKAFKRIMGCTYQCLTRTTITLVS
jgi:hypothetical protein